MRLVPANIGAEPKKIAWLGGLLAVAAVVWWINSGPSSSGGAAPAAASRGAVAAAPAKVVAPRPASRAGIRSIDDFKPSLKLKEDVDISKVDPTLKLDLLAKLWEVGLDRGTRGSVFDWGKAPPPAAATLSASGVKNIVPGQVAEVYGPFPPPPPPPPAKPKPTPPPPPIPLKFYGFSSHTGLKRAFFLDGDDIDVAAENEVIKNRYKVIKIGVNSVEMEDLNYKHQQTLPLIAELSG